MRKTKMLAALLAGLITLSLAGCGADKTENTGSDPASTESGITATVTDNASEPTAESSLPAESESKSDESTAEKEQAERCLPIRKHHGARENGIASAMPFFSFLP